MSSKRHLILLTLILTILGLWGFLYKWLVLDLPLTPSGTSTVWTVETRINFDASGAPVKVSFSIPPEQMDFQRLSENFVSRNYGSSITKKDDNRIATLSIRRATDAQTLYYRASFYDDPNPRENLLSVRGKSERPTFEGAQKTAAETLIANVRETSADSLSFASGIIKQLLSGGDNVGALLNNDNSTENIAKTAVEILKGPSAEIGPNITARMVYGFQLPEDVESRKNISLVIYLAVLDIATQKWNYINPETGNVGLPAHFLVWQYGDSPLINVEGGSNPSLNFSFSKKLQGTLSIAQEEAFQSKSLLMEFSLFSLPLQTQMVYQTLIMIPLGALMILILRSFVGIKTFGTFMPVLIALAFRETHLFSGILLFVIIVALGLSVRFYLEHLKLLLIPRLTAVLSSVVIIMMFMSVISYKLGFSHGLSLALFPMVILTMTIERMSIVWEERNPWEAIQQAGGSLLAATLAYILMINHQMEHLMFVFPELLLVLMSIMLWLGRYHGYRITELMRFKDLVTKDRV